MDVALRGLFDAEMTIGRRCFRAGAIGTGGVAMSVTAADLHLRTGDIEDIFRMS